MERGNLKRIVASSEEELDRILNALTQEELDAFDEETEVIISKLDSITIADDNPRIPLSQKVQQQESASGKLIIPVGYTPVISESDGLTASEREFIQLYNLDMPSSLAMRAKRVFNAEPSIAGFAFENFVAATVALYCINAKKNKVAEEFLMYNYIMDKNLRGGISGPDEVAIRNLMNKYLPPDQGTLLAKYPGPIDLPTKVIFLDYCKNRIPGVGKPAGGSQTVGPDLCMWLKEDVFWVFGSKLSKKAYTYTNAIRELVKQHSMSIYDLWNGDGVIPKTNPAHKRKATNEVLVSRQELLDNVNSISIERYGSKHNDAAFGDAVKAAFFEHKTPLKLYIEVNCVLPFRATSVSSGNAEYDSAVDLHMRTKEVTVNYGGKSAKVNVLRINVHNTNVVSSGLLSTDDESLLLLKKLLIDPMMMLETIEKNIKR